MAESVWDYPRPPRVERSRRRIRVVLGGGAIADSTRTLRMLEKSLPPSYYIPFEDVVPGALEPSPTRTTFCEWKGTASYFDVLGADGRRVERGAWTYPEPLPGLEEIAGCAGFYPGLMDECTVDGEAVQAQEGGFYGGWITSDVTGPFTGGPGTEGR